MGAALVLEDGREVRLSPTCRCEGVGVIAMAEEVVGRR